MSSITRSFNTGQSVHVVDPDLEQPTIVAAKYAGQDKQTGDHLVVIDGEPDAQRRITDDRISRCRDGLALKAGLTL